MELKNEPEAVRAKLPFEACRRMMQYARRAEIPACPNNIGEVITQLENQRLPPLYQDMYLGHVTHEVPASKK
jgi:hypothetical protein